YLRCVGARLLSRLPEPSARLRPDLPRPPDQLGLRRPEPLEISLNLAERPRPGGASLRDGPLGPTALRCIDGRSCRSPELGPSGHAQSRAVVCAMPVHEPCASRKRASRLRDRAEARYYVLCLVR